MRKPSVVIDTNIFLSAIILPKSKPSQIISFWRKSKFSLVTSQILLRELNEVLERKKYREKYSITPHKKELLLQLIAKKAIIIHSLHRLTLEIRDPKDLPVLATAITGKAEYLVTGDKDLLSLRDQKEIKPLVIITPQQFLDFLRGVADTRL